LGLPASRHPLEPHSTNYTFYIIASFKEEPQNDKQPNRNLSHSLHPARQHCNKETIKMKTKFFAILFIAITTVFIYFITIFSIELSYFIAYKFVKPRSFLDFGKTIWIYCDYILPYIFIFTNLMLVLMKNKKVIRVVIILIYAIFIFLFWCNYFISMWPYRVIPIFCVVTSFYLLDILIVRFIMKKSLQRTVAPPKGEA